MRCCHRDREERPSHLSYLASRRFKEGVYSHAFFKTKGLRFLTVTLLRRLESTMCSRDSKWKNTLLADFSRYSLLSDGIFFTILK